MAERDKNRLGLWKRQGKDGQTYLNGSIEIDGVDHWMNIYPNKYWEAGSNKPTHNLVLSPKEKRSGGTNNAQSGGEMF